MKWAGGNVVLLELDYPKHAKPSAEIKKQNEALKQRFQISKYPTILLIDQDGEMLGEVDYAKHATPAAFIERAESILKN
jgi:thioredoxin-related protein